MVADWWDFLYIFLSNLSFIPPTFSKKIDAEIMKTAFSIWSVPNSVAKGIQGMQTISNLPISTWHHVRLPWDTAKQKDRLTCFIMFNVLEAKIFKYDFLEGHNVWQNWLSTQRNVVTIMATKPEFLVAKDEMLLALATLSVVISSPGMAFKILCPC